MWPWIRATSFGVNGEALSLWHSRAGELWWGAPLAGCVFHTRHSFSTMCEILWPMGLSGKEKKNHTLLCQLLRCEGHCLLSGMQNLGAEMYLTLAAEMCVVSECGGCASRKPSWVWHVSPQREISVSLTITLMLQDTLSFIFLFGIWRPH